MIMMVLGLAVWTAAHLFKRLAPRLREGLGETPGKIVVSLASLAAIVLMVKGFKAASPIEIWAPPAFLTEINNLLMLLAVFLLNLGYSKGMLRTRIRHPMLTAVKTWAFAHLLVNGDLAGMVLFGWLMVWAILTTVLINRQQPDWSRPPPGPLRNDMIYAVVSLGLFAVFTSIHARLGVWPFG